MKKIRSFILTITMLSVFTSCEKFLEVNPQGNIDGPALSDADGIDLLVTSAYASLHESTWGGSPNNFLMGSIYGGDANKGSDPGDQPYMNEFENYGVLTNNIFLNEKWIFNYNGVKRANHTINMINSIEGIDEEFANKRLGEMRFLRALFYFELRRVFKNVPFVDIDTEAKENNPKVKNDTEILPMIKEDLELAISLLPDVQDAVGRANKWAAKSLLAKVMMFEGQFSDVTPLLKDIIDNGVNAGGVKYQLVEKYSDNFNISTENNSETVFSIQHSVDAGDANANPGHGANSLYGGALNGGGYGFYQPSYSFVNSFQVDANGLPKLDGSYMDNVIPGVDIQEASDINDADRTIPVDPRLDHSVGRRGIPYYDWGMPQNTWVRNPSYAGPFMPKKNLHRKSDSHYVVRGSALNTDLIRFADVLLWYAEALAETGRYTEAAEYVNLVRRRAANDLVMFEGQPAANYKVGEYPLSYFDDKAKALKAIRFERKLEFGMEGIRFFDLQRWGFDVAKAEIDWYLQKEKQHLGKFATVPLFTEYKMYFAIPEAQILSMDKAEDGQPYLQQNTGY